MLNDKQLQYLEKYCEMNEVGYYDLQLEVIDHIATMIEDVQENDPSIDFNSAFNLVNAQFSKNDFRMMIKAKKKVLEKRISVLIKKEFISFFTVPRIFLTVLFYTLAYNVPALLQKNNIAGIAGICILFSPIIYYMIRYRNLNAFSGKNDNTNLLSSKVRSRYEIIAQVSFPAIYFGTSLLRSFFDIHISKPATLMSSMLLLMVTVELLNIAILHVRFAFNEKMKKEYPGAFMQA